MLPMADVLRRIAIASPLLSFIDERHRLEVSGDGHRQLLTERSAGGRDQLSADRGDGERCKLPDTAAADRFETQW